MRITICGATGRVGSALLDCVRAAPDLTLAEAVSAGGRDGTVPLDRAEFTDTDVIVDFSTPAGTLALLRRLDGQALPVVVGTTGFDEDGMAELEGEAAVRPILFAANFTKGFELFAASAETLAKGIPDAEVTVGEVYNAKKKPVASGTTQRLCARLGADGREIGTDVQRVGDTPGINWVSLDYGVATLRLELVVHSRAAYAEGALDAARWLLGRPPRFYRLHDTLSTEQEVS
jgi:4-hydroxy-tetrahydrodipicolinate reductase